MNDEELRRRLRDIPSPRAGIDADAVVAAARRRRWPKAIALSSAATVASVLIVAPLAVTGLQLLPQSASQQASSDAGAESAEQPQPDAASEEAQLEESSAGEGDTGAAGDLPPTGGNDAAASGAASLVCGLQPATELGLELTFADDPSDGSARVEVRGADGAAVPRFEVIEIESLDSADGMARVWAGAASQELALTAGESAELEVPTAVLQLDACDAAPASAPAPVAIVVRGTGAPTAVLGEPWR